VGREPRRAAPFQGCLYESGQRLSPEGSDIPGTSDVCSDVHSIVEPFALQC